MPQTRLQYTTSFTVNLTDIKPVADALSALSAAHEQSAVRIEAATVRWRDSGLWVQVTLAVDTDAPEVGRDALAQAAVDTGLASGTQTAREEIQEVTV